MARIALLLFLHIVCSALSKDCVINNQPVEFAWKKQLKKDLSRTEFITTPPINNQSESASISLRFILKSFEFDSKEEVFSMHTWIILRWTDDRLKWEPEKYGGITETVIRSPNIWMPVFRVFNSAEEMDFDKFLYVNCDLQSNGKLSCMPREQHYTTCSVNLANWPYDRQKCSVIYGAWTPHSKERVRLEFDSPAISMLGAEYGAEWTIVDYQQDEDQNSDKQLTMTFVLDREAASLAAIVIYPTYVLTALNIIVLFLDPRRYSRLYLVCFSIFGHFYYLTEIGEKIPKESLNPPILLLYYRASLILSVLGFFLTIFMAFLCTKTRETYSMIISANNYVYKSYGRYLVYPKWESEKNSLSEEENSFNDGWTNFANVINNVYAFIIVVVYIILYCSFIPQPHPWIM